MPKARRRRRRNRRGAPGPRYRSGRRAATVSSRPGGWMSRARASSKPCAGHYTDPSHVSRRVTECDNSRMSVTTHPLLEELAARDLIVDSTPRDELAAHLSEARRSLYIGFDPTADSLHVG